MTTKYDIGQEVFYPLVMKNTPTEFKAHVSRGSISRIIIDRNAERYAVRGLLWNPDEIYATEKEAEDAIERIRREHFNTLADS